MTLTELESAVTGLSPDDLARFRAWFAEYDGEIWDRQIEEDAKNGKLDTLAEEAIRAHRAGETTEL